MSAWWTVASRGELVNATLFRVQDPIPSRHSTATQMKLQDRAKEFEGLGGNLGDVEEHDLFERTERIVESVKRFLNKGTENLIFDISSLPKRFFFPIVRLILQNRQVTNVIVTYTVPERYSAEPLSEDPEPWRNIPLFAPPYPEPEPKVFLVAMGFETLGLPGLLGDDFHSVSVKLIFPFPPGPPNFQRTWEFVRSLERNLPQSKLEPIRVDARDASDAFNHICSATDHGSQYTIFAPYGPKPISLAIAIYATMQQSAVYYTQPRVYNPDYCRGVARVNELPATYAYCLRLSGADLYSVV